MSEEKEENVVDGPSLSVTHPEKKAKRDAKKSVEEERFGVLQVSHKVGTFFSVSMIISGILLLFLSIYQLITNSNLLSEGVFLILLIYVFVSLVNSIGGLLLMGTH